MIMRLIGDDGSGYHGVIGTMSRISAGGGEGVAEAFLLGQVA